MFSSVIPDGLKPLLRRFRKAYRGLLFRLSQLWDPTQVSATQVTEAFRRLGLMRGDWIFLQSSMSAFGRIQGGADTVIESLKALVGPEGLVVMPAFPLDGTGREHLSRDPLFDVRATPSTMGAITEAFRQQKDVFRSLHPTHSVCAWGARAEEFVAGHEHAATPFGEGTPFARLIEHNALQVWFGCRLRAITLYHAFECLHPAFPIRVFDDSTFAARCRKASGELVIVHTPVHDPRLAPYRIDRRPELEARLKLRLVQEGVLHSLRLGKGEILAARSRPLFAAFERLLAEGLTIYALPTGREE